MYNLFVEQYRHGIYYHNDQQKFEAEATLALEQKRYSKPIVTEVKPAKLYWPAELYHQQVCFFFAY